MFNLILGTLLLGIRVLCSAPSGPWDAFNFAPQSRTVYPRSIRETHGNVTNLNILSNGSLTISGNESHVAFDFGYEVRLFPLFMAAKGSQDHRLRRWQG